MSVKTNLVFVFCFIVLLTTASTQNTTRDTTTEATTKATTTEATTKATTTEATTKATTTATTTTAATTTAATTTKATTTAATTTKATTTAATTTNATTTAATTTNATTTEGTTTKGTTTEGTTTKGTTTEGTTTTIPPYHPPKPFPGNIGHWNNSCVRVNAAFEIIVPIDYQNKTKQNETVVVPEFANVVGNCSNETTTLSLSWTVEASYNPTSHFLNVLELEFAKEDSKKLYRLSKIAFRYNLQQFVNIGGNDTVVSAGNMTYFETPVGKSFLCNSEASITHSDGKGFQFQLNMAQVQLEAFTTESKFSPSEQCKADEKPHKSKALLIGLTVSFSILFVAAGVGYFFWRRRRAQQSGYQRLDDY